MTHVSTPKTGAFQKGRTGTIRSMVGAVVITVAAGAAIATGLLISQQDESTSAAVSSAYTERWEANRLENLLHENEAAAAAQSERAATILPEDLVRYGFVPEQGPQPASGGFAESPGQPR